MKEAQQLMDLLLKRHMTFGSAESCTGGNIAHEMTMLAGVSEVLKSRLLRAMAPCRNRQRVRWPKVRGRCLE